MSVEALRAELAAIAPLPDPTPYLSEPRGRWVGQGVVATPRSTSEVSEVLRLCHSARVPVVPYGGGTGLVGGQISPEPAVILSLEKMDRVLGVNPAENVMNVEAGAILANVQAAAAEADRLFPLSLASEGSARIGGLLATNAGGVGVLRYGNARALCLGLEVVLADGTVWNGLSPLRKDNTGYDLRNLMIGSEGTLGVITAASLKLFPRPRAVGTALMSAASPQAALELLTLAQSRFGEQVSAFELIGRQGPEFLAEVGPEVRQPLTPLPDWMVLIEVGLAGGDAAEALLALFEEAMAAGLSDNGTIAQSEAQRQELWALREAIPAANRRIGSVSSHDISVPISKIPEFIAQGPVALAHIGDIRINCFGHLGDGNLHYNVFPAKGLSRDAYDPAPVKRAVHDLVHQFGGSVSAEHGVGRLKVADLERYSDPVKLKMMAAVKAALDPEGILNPGAVVPKP